MSERREHRRRINEKMERIREFEQGQDLFLLWLSEEPPMIRFISWRKWLKSRPQMEAFK